MPALGILLIAFAACGESAPSQSEFVLGTLCTITLYDEGKPQVYRDIFARLREIENTMSVHIEGSDPDRIKAGAGTGAVKVNAKVFGVIEKALYYAELSGGAFNPAVGPLAALWDIGGDNPRLPEQEEIDRVLPRIDWRDIELDRENTAVFLKKPGMALDLGGIAKGYAADEAAGIIRRAGISRAVIDLGGNILVVGEKKDKSLWNVGIQNPLNDRGAYLGIVRVKEKTVVTSGVYERFFEDRGIKYHHIFSPSGYPADNGLLSVTVITDSSLDGDALSTAAFVLGSDKGMALIKSLEGTEAVFVLEDRSVRLSPGVDFILRDTGYRVVSD